MLHDQEHALSEEETQAQAYRYACSVQQLLQTDEHNTLHLNLSIASPPADDERHQNSAVCAILYVSCSDRQGLRPDRERAGKTSLTNL